MRSSQRSGTEYGPTNEVREMTDARLGYSVGIEPLSLLRSQSRSSSGRGAVRSGGYRKTNLRVGGATGMSPSPHPSLLDNSGPEGSVSNYRRGGNGSAGSPKGLCAVLCPPPSLPRVTECGP